MDLETRMTSRNQDGMVKMVKPIFAGSARSLERARLMAPRPVKALAEHALADVSIRPKEHDLPLPPNLRPKVDRHVHSLGYGIDE
jgi:hypothetical protein